MADEKQENNILPLEEIYEGYGNEAVKQTAQKSSRVMGRNRLLLINRHLLYLKEMMMIKEKPSQSFMILDADAVYEKMKLEMRTSGIKSIPRGIRKSTQIKSCTFNGPGTRCFTVAKRRTAEQRNCLTNFLYLLKQLIIIFPPYCSNSM